MSLYECKTHVLVCVSSWWGHRVVVETLEGRLGKGSEVTQSTPLKKILTLWPFLSLSFCFPNARRQAAMSASCHYALLDHRLKWWVKWLWVESLTLWPNTHLCSHKLFCLHSSRAWQHQLLLLQNTVQSHLPLQCSFLWTILHAQLHRCLL